jgi:hypothetical protein
MAPGTWLVVLQRTGTFTAVVGECVWLLKSMAGLGNLIVMRRSHLMPRTAPAAVHANDVHMLAI